MKITIGDVTLYDSTDGTGSALSGLDGTIGRLVEESPVLDAAMPFIKDRANKTVPVSFTVSRPNADAEAALVAMFIDEASIPADTALLIQQGSRTITVPGTFERVRVRHTGSRSFHDYSFRGGRPRVDGDPIADDDGTPLTDDDGTPLTG